MKIINPPRPLEAVKKLVWCCFTSFRPRIKYGVNSTRATEGRRSERSERAHPVFSRVKSTLDPGFHRGDEYSVIFSQLPFNKGGLEGFE